MTLRTLRPGYGQVALEARRFAPQAELRPLTSPLHGCVLARYGFVRTSRRSSGLPDESSYRSHPLGGRCAARLTRSHRRERPNPLVADWALNGPAQSAFSLDKKVVRQAVYAQQVRRSPRHPLAILAARLCTYRIEVLALQGSAGPLPLLVYSPRLRQALE